MPASFTLDEVKEVVDNLLFSVSSQQDPYIRLVGIPVDFHTDALRDVLSNVAEYQKKLLNIVAGVTIMNQRTHVSRSDVDTAIQIMVAGVDNILPDGYERLDEEWI